MPSQLHQVKLNIKPCMACEEKSLSHNLTGVEKQCNSKTQPVSQADL
ncbi:MAG: hypothetical protein NWE95_02420 [Candidatus Bathyarchaeota archaeon]|nr:hypothetical protein [Candidatus Bathyarchaeota archaeon]